MNYYPVQIPASSSQVLSPMQLFAALAMVFLYLYSAYSVWPLLIVVDATKVNRFPVFLKLIKRKMQISRNRAGYFNLNLLSCINQHCRIYLILTFHKTDFGYPD